MRKIESGTEISGVAFQIKEGSIFKIGSSKEMIVV